MSLYPSDQPSANLSLVARSDMSTERGYSIGRMWIRSISMPRSQSARLWATSPSKESLMTAHRWCGT